MWIARHSQFGCIGERRPTAKDRARDAEGKQREAAAVARASGGGELTRLVLLVNEEKGRELER